MLANLYEHKCPKCKRVSMVVAKIKPVTVTFTPAEARVTLAAVFQIAYVQHGKGKIMPAIQSAYDTLRVAIKQQTKPRRKV